MKVAYYLNPERKKNLYCRISDAKERVTFSLEYQVDLKEWDSKQEEVSCDNEHFFTLRQFKEYLNKKYLELKTENKTDILSRLKTEALSFIKGAGINGVARKMFDFFHQGLGLPRYDEFVKAFEKFSNLKKGQYKVEPLDSLIHFHTEEEIYEMDTYEGRTIELKRIINERLYDELCVMTDVNIWNDIYSDPGIEKSVFLPRMLNEWEIYWNDKYEDIRERTGKTSHLDSSKTESWRQFQVFMQCYENGGDMIHLAYEIDDLVLYPIAVLTMMNVFDAHTCYGEYCEYEFSGSGGWESISIDEESDESSIFYIKPYEF